ncbi:MAG: hypothetical protein H6Q17_1962 [Bacteroidetes bacterium]|jgi:hypothetical protein|nr:hypothetical protein [Bacteroidota bacterium]
MNETFNIQRLYRVVATETFAFRRYYLFYVIFAAAYAASDILINRTGFHPGVFAGLGIFLIIISPFMLYNDVFHKIKGVNYTMLPASNLEKWIAFWFQNVIVVPLIIGLLWLILWGLEYFLFGRPIDIHIGKEEWSTYLIGILGIQGIAMVGTLSFRRLKWLKTLGAIFVLQVASLLIGRLLMYQFDLKSFIIEIQAANLIPDSSSWLIDYIKIVAYIIFPFGLWLVSFFKLQEQEL